MEKKKGKEERRHSCFQLTSFSRLPAKYVNRKHKCPLFDSGGGLNRRDFGEDSFLIPDAAVVIKQRDGTFVVNMIEIGSGRQTVNELRNRLRFGVDSLPQRVRDTIKFLDHFITPGPDAG